MGKKIFGAVLILLGLYFIFLADFSYHVWVGIAFLVADAILWYPEIKKMGQA